MKQKDDLLIFVHIPKTAGYSLIDTLERNFEEHEITRWSHRKPPWLDYMEGDESQFYKIKCIHGHISLPDFENLEPFKDRNKTFITMLRHPVDRTISYYYHTNKEMRKPISEWLNECGRDDYFQRRVNAMTYALAGDKELTNDSLKKAKDNLTRTVFGIQNAFDYSLHWFQQNLPGYFKDINYEMKNVSKVRLENEDIPPDLYMACMSLNDLDMELWHYATDLLMELDR